MSGSAATGMLARLPISGSACSSPQKEISNFGLMRTMLATSSPNPSAPLLQYQRCDVLWTIAFHFAAKCHTGNHTGCGGAIGDATQDWPFRPAGGAIGGLRRRPGAAKRPLVQAVAGKLPAIDPRSIEPLSDRYGGQLGFRDYQARSDNTKAAPRRLFGFVDMNERYSFTGAAMPICRPAVRPGNTR